MNARRAGFSLLEVLLAMSILLGSIIVLGELARQGRRNATAARDLTRAQLICQSKLNEIIIGVAPLEPVSQVEVEEAPGWLYSVELEPVDLPELDSLKVTVVQDLPGRKEPVEFSLTRWVRQSDAQSNLTRPVESSVGEGRAFGSERSRP